MKTGERGHDAQREKSGKQMKCDRTNTIKHQEKKSYNKELTALINTLNDDRTSR